MTDTPILNPLSQPLMTDTPPPSAVMLVSLNHPSLRPFNLDTGTLSIGRDPAADIFLDSPDVSRLHAMIRAVGERVEVVDAKSSNGTFLNGTKIDRAVIRFGDVVRIGNEELKVVPRPSLEIDTGQAIDLDAAQAVSDEAIRLLAEERRQLAILYTMALRFLETGGRQHPIELFFSMLDRVVSFDAAFVILSEAGRSTVHHHPAGIRLKNEEVAHLLSKHSEEARAKSKAFDGPEDAISLSTYKARSRAFIPLPGIGFLVLLAGVPAAYSVQLDFLDQVGRILSAGLRAREDSTTL